MMTEERRNMNYQKNILKHRKTLWKSLILTILLSAAVMVGLAGCSTPPTPEPETREPFSARRESEDGAIVFWSGFTAGYEPGQEDEFELQIENQTGEAWEGRFCLQLLAQDAPLVLHTLEQRDFTLEPGVGFSDTLTVRLPETLDDGVYGLSMVVRRSGGPMVDLIPVQVGEAEGDRGPTTQADMDAALEACPPVDRSADMVEQAKADLAQRLGITLDEIEVQSVESTEFPDASLGVPEEGQTYAQVITPGYIMTLLAEGETYRYHGAEGRVVFVPEEQKIVPAEPGETPETDAYFEVPSEGAQVVLPLHVLAHVGQPKEGVTLLLRWEDGTELSKTFTTLADPQGRGLLIKSLNWQTEGQPPQLPTGPASLTIQNKEGEVLAETLVTVLNPDHPQTELIDLYWALGEDLEAEQRRVLKTGSIEQTALEELLWGPPPRNLAGFRTAIPTPEEVLTYPGRQADWGLRVKLLGLTIEDGLATVNFSQEMKAYGGGSMRVQTIREQITRTLIQFPSVDEVQIAVEGETEGVLQP
jgi:hypothetical protein